ncbi:MAG: sensor histidine kinase [Nitrospirae bacterium]|nr:MAG: sensor histidine kinase [Nitrospirota bacterium]
MTLHLLEKLKEWTFSLQGKFILTASVCILIFTTVGSFIILEREKNLYKLDIVNQGKVFAEISRVMLTNVMIYNDLGIMDRQDTIDYLDYFIMNLMERDRRIKYVAVVDNDGKVVAHSNIADFGYGTQYRDNAMLLAMKTLQPLIAEEYFENKPVISIATPLNISTKKWGGLAIGLSTEEMQKAVNILKKEIVYITLIFSTISLLIISIGAKVLAKPVIKLSSIMDNIKTKVDLEQYNIEFKDRRDEIGKLKKSFLWMIQRLRDADREHKKTLELLGQSEKMAAIGKLASGVAHEINNPLGGITVCFKNLMKTDMDEATKQEHIEVVNDGLLRIKNIVEQLLNFSKMAVTEKSPADLNSLITRQLLLLNYYLSEKKIKVVREFFEQMSVIALDENKMGQVIMNIMINAIQAMDNGGVMTVRTRQNKDSCEIEVEDTGKGIPVDIMGNIFDPFFTTKTVGEGTGLGLSVSRGIVEQHGGIIEVESAVNVGTKFRIKLPDM